MENEIGTGVCRDLRINGFHRHNLGPTHNCTYDRAISPFNPPKWLSLGYNASSYSYRQVKISFRGSGYCATAKAVKVAKVCQENCFSKTPGAILY